MTAIQKSGERISEASVGDEVVIMRLDTGEFFSLTGTGAAIWRLIDGRRDRKELVSALADAFDSKGCEIGRDVDEFLRDLAKSGLLAE